MRPITCSPAHVVRQCLSALGLALALVATPMATPAQNLQTLAVPDTTVQDLMNSDKARSRADTYYLLALSYARKGNQAEADAVIERGLKLERANPRLLGLKAAMAARAGRISEAVAGFRRVLQITPDDEYARRSLATIQAEMKAANQTIRPPTPSRDGVALISPAALSSAGGGASAGSAEGAPKSGGKAAGKGSGDGSGAGSGSAPAGGADGSASARQLDLSYFSDMRTKQRCYFVLTSLKRARDGFMKAHPKTKDEVQIEDLLREKFLSSPPRCPESGDYSWQGDAPKCSRHGELNAVETEVVTLFKEFNQGLQAKLGRNYPDAIKAFTQVTTLYPRWSEAYYQLGDALFRSGDDKAAVEQLKHCLKVDPSHLDAQMLLANLYYKQGLRDVAVQLLTSIERRVPGSVYAVSAKSIADGIRAGRNYYQLFPPQ